MKWTAVTFVATASLALASHHNHERRHAHHHLHHLRPNVVKRVPDVVTHSVFMPAATVIVYELNGSMIPEAEVMEGIKNGTLRLGEDGVVSTAQPAAFAEAAPSSQTPPPAPPPAYSSPPPPSPPPPPAPPAAGIDADYDESLDCGTFPSAWGAMPVNWLGLGGWIGIQNPGYSGGDGYNNIQTVNKGMCNGDSCCGEGMFCSYSCPPGYQKTQWPALQGVTGQSVGGLKCIGGKLKLTRGDVTRKLCEKGTKHVSIKIKNNMSQGSAVCRTDYPGTESETVPLWAAPGSVQDLTCPDGATYYKAHGNPTSAQYYVNPAGVSVEDGCQWGDSSHPTGNYAPLNLGVGYSHGKAWISIFQNAPTTDAKLDFTVEVQGDDISGKCRYQNGQYCSGDSYQNCNGKEGCTVAVSSGTAYFVFS